MHLNGHQVALWAGASAFCGSLLAIGAVDIFNLSGIAEFGTSVIVAAVTAAGVYAHERLADAKKEQEHAK